MNLNKDNAGARLQEHQAWLELLRLRGRDLLTALDAMPDGDHPQYPMDRGIRNDVQDEIRMQLRIMEAEAIIAISRIQS